MARRGALPRLRLAHDDHYLRRRGGESLRKRHRYVCQPPASFALCRAAQAISVPSEGDMDKVRTTLRQVSATPSYSERPLSRSASELARQAYSRRSAWPRALAADDVFASCAVGSLFAIGARRGSLSATSATGRSSPSSSAFTPRRRPSGRCLAPKRSPAHSAALTEPTDWPHDQQFGR